MRILSILFLIFSTTAMASDVVSFSTAKKRLYKVINENHGSTAYCGCRWASKKVDLFSCGLQNSFTKKQRRRANRTEVEHLHPISAMLKKNGQWRSCAIAAKTMGVSGRKHCQKVDIEYRRAHNDLTNLRIVVGAVNEIRSNKPFVETVKHKNQYNFGRCKIEMDRRSFAPPAALRGDVARIGFYLEETYGMKISARQRALYMRWDQADPLDYEEIERHKQINKIQGYGLTF